MKTFAEGLATRVAFELPQRIMWELLDDFVLVSDDEIRAAQRLMIESTRNLIEAAGASPLAAAIRLRDTLAGKRVALIASGGNASPRPAARAYSRERRLEPGRASTFVFCAGRDVASTSQARGLTSAGALLVDGACGDLLRPVLRPPLLELALLDVLVLTGSLACLSSPRVAA